VSTPSSAGREAFAMTAHPTPQPFPPRSTVFNICRKFPRDRVWQAIWAEWHLALRKQMGHEAAPRPAGIRNPARKQTFVSLSALALVAKKSSRPEEKRVAHLRPLPTRSTIATMSTGPKGVTIAWISDVMPNFKGSIAIGPRGCRVFGKRPVSHEDDNHGQ